MANQFNNMQMGIPLPDVPPVTELWKDEKNRFRHWIILLGVALFVVLGFYLASLIWNTTSKGEIRSIYTDTLTSSGAFKTLAAADRVVAIEDSFNSYWQQTILIFPIIVTVLISMGVSGYVFGVYDSYRKKSFAALRGWASLIIGLTAFIAFYELISMAWRGTFEFQYQGGVFQFIARLLVVITGIVFLTPVSNIRRIFVLSIRVSELKSNTNFQAMQNPAAQAQSGAPGGAAPFGIFGPIAPQTSQTAPSQPVSQPLPAKQLSKQEQDLNLLSVAELHKVASKLSISGQDTMDKGELIRNILRVTESASLTSETKQKATLEELEKMSLAELRQVAKRLAISGFEKMSKAELLSSIKRIYEK